MALILIITLLLMLTGAMVLVRWRSQAGERELARQSALRAELDALRTTQRLSALAWETRQAMYQAAVDRSHP